MKAAIYARYSSDQQVEREIDNLVAFIKAGTVTPTLSDELRKTEVEKQRLVDELDTEVPAIENIDALFEDAVNRFASMAHNFEDFAARDITMAREMI